MYDSSSGDTSFTREYRPARGLCRPLLIAAISQSAGLSEAPTEHDHEAGLVLRGDRVGIGDAPRARRNGHARYEGRGDLYVGTDVGGGAAQARLHEIAGDAFGRGPAQVHVTGQRRGVHVAVVQRTAVVEH